MIIYAFSGLGADERVFTFLNLPYKIKTVNWISPQVNESIELYSKRISTKIDTTTPFALLGVSFGGLVVAEINKILHLSSL